MAEYGTIEYFQEELNKNLQEKSIYYNALKNIVREESCGVIIDTKLFDLIVGKIYATNINIEWSKENLEWSKENLQGIYKQKLEKGKSEQNDN